MQWESTMTQMVLEASKNIQDFWKNRIFFGKNMANTIIFPVSKADFRLEASDIFTLFDPSLVTQWFLFQETGNILPEQ